VSGRKREVDVSEVVPDSDGSIKGIAADGTPIKGRIAGKSLARQLMEKEEKRKEEELKKKQGRKRKRKRKG
jgi:hypothetical protein